MYNIRDYRKRTSEYSKYKGIKREWEKVVRTQEKERQFGSLRVDLFPLKPFGGNIFRVNYCRKQPYLFPYATIKVKTIVS
jgi:hypothetical protein